MTRTTKKAPPPAKPPRNPDVFCLRAATPEEQTRKGAELATTGGVNALLVRTYMPIDGIGTGDLQEELARQAQALQSDGDRIHQAEAMLLNQAAALQAMFIDLANRAKLQNSREFIQCLTGLALRAQTNCTQTLKTLGELRNPRQAVFAKQANIAHGYQQVNNGQQALSTSNTRSGAHETPIEQNKLLENSHGQWLDTRAARTSGRIDSDVETVGAVHWANNR